MRRVSLNDDRAACCKRRSCIAARYGESQREIAGAKDSHGSKCYFAHPQVRTWPWRAIREGCIQPSIDPTAISNYRGEQVQLSYRTDALPFDARLCAPYF